MSPSAQIGEDCEIGPFTVVGPDVRIGDRTKVGSHCLLGERAGEETGPLVIGPDSHVRSHSVIYAGSTFGPELETGHRVTLREGLRVGRNLRVGTLSDLQGDATIGDYVRMHSNVHCGKGASIASCVWIFPYVVLTNDPHPPSDGFLAGVTVEEFAVIATSSVVLPGVTVGRGAFVGAQALVRRDVPADTVCVGNPGRLLGPTSAITLQDGSGPAYPWRRHFHRGYPAELADRWREEFPNG